MCVAEASCDLSVLVGELELANPLLAASGCFGYGLEYDPLLPPEEFGAFVTKTVTPLPRTGNPVPRLMETASGMLNSIGLENVGIEAFITEKLPALAERGLRPVVSISAGSADEFAAMGSELSGGPALALELNLSCPNVASGGVNFAQSPDAVTAITRAVKATFTSGPIWVKLTPSVTDIGAVALAAERGGADGIAAINTLIGMDIDLATGKSPFARTTAGLSGPAILPVALAAVHRIASVVEIPIIGIGGACSATDVLKFIAAGAAAVQLGTMLFSDPGLPVQIKSEMADFLASVDCRSIADLREFWANKRG